MDDKYAFRMELNSMHFGCLVYFNIKATELKWYVYQQHSSWVRITWYPPLISLVSVPLREVRTVRLDCTLISLLPSLNFFTNPRFVLLIRDQSFVLFSFRRASTFITNLRHLHDTYILRHPPERFRLWQLAEVRKRCLYYFKYGYLPYKNASICYRRPLFTPRSHVMRILIWMHMLYLTTFDLLNTTTRPCHYKVWKSQDNFEYNSNFWVN